VSTRQELQQAIAHEIEGALREHYGNGYFRRPRVTQLPDYPCFVSPDGTMSWRDSSGRQVIVTIAVAGE
jgi:hypothetical protein